LSISADGYEDLRAAIVDGDLLPGERLLEEELGARFGLGRAAVRMALVRLEHDGLVERERHRGARIRMRLITGGQHVVVGHPADQRGRRDEL